MEGWKEVRRRGGRKERRKDEGIEGKNEGRKEGWKKIEGRKKVMNERRK